MYQRMSGPGRKRYVVYTNLDTGETIESPTLRDDKDANCWIERHARQLRTTGEPQMRNRPWTLEETVRTLAEMTTRDDAGTHFTERYAGDILDMLESEELIVIHRPIHQPTGIPYGQDQWSVEVTSAGANLVQANPEYWPE